MKVYTPEEVAEALKLNVNTVWRYIKDGKLTAAKFGNRYRISEKQLEEFFERMSTEPDDSGDAED
jgi:excisionase family DNA binding protein